MVTTWPPGNGRGAPSADRAAERVLREEVHEAVTRLLGERQLLTPGREDEERIRALIREHVAAYQRRAATTNVPVLADPEEVERRLFDGLLRLGLLQPFMDDPSIEEVICNGPQRIFVIQDGAKRLVPDLYFEDDEELRQLVKRLVGPLGRRLDEASPMVDARLPDGSRLNAAIPPATTRWCCLTIRKFILRANTLEQLVALGTLTGSAATFLDACVQAGVNILVSGPTGAGKCVAGDTRVTLADGRLMPIRELVEESFARYPPTIGTDGWASAPSAHQVLTCDFGERCIRPAAGVTAWRHPAPELLIEVETRTGQRVRVTPEHPFFSVVSGEIVQVRADRLRIGDRIAVSNEVPTAGNLPDLMQLLGDCESVYLGGGSAVIRSALDRIRAIEGLRRLQDVFVAVGLPWTAGKCWWSENAVPLPAFRKLCARARFTDQDLPTTVQLKSRTGRRTCLLARRPSPPLCRLAGLVVGDGHIRGSFVELTSATPEVRGLFGDLCRELFGVAPHLRPSESRCPTLVLGSSVAAEVLVRAYGIPRGAKARAVRVPTWLFAAPAEHIAAFLSGLLDTDGSIFAPAPTRAGRVEFCTSSAGLAEDIVALLARLGVRSHLVRRRRGFIVCVYDLEGILRLRRVLVLAHPQRRAVLNAYRSGTGYSSVDVIPGLAGPLREARLAAGMSYADLARALGVSGWLPALYERGERYPTRTRVLDFASRMQAPDLASRLRSVATQPVYWDRVTALRPLRDHGERYVYDLTVPGTHTFLVGPGGVVAHNTTLLNGLGACIASLDERIVTVEEVAELQLERQLPDCVALQARAGNVEGVGEIRIRDLVRNALRMRPTRIVVGEARGPEALDLLLAMNTGHDGSLATVHGNSPRDALDRLVTLAMMAEERLSNEALTKMVSRTIELVLQLRFEPRTHRRRLVSIFEVTGLEGSVITGQELWTIHPARDRLVWTGIQPRCLAKIAAKGVPYALPSAAEVPA